LSLIRVSKSTRVMWVKQKLGSVFEPVTEGGLHLG